MFQHKNNNAQTINTSFAWHVAGKTAGLLALMLFHGNIHATEPYIFSAPPRGAETNETKAYQPIADYLSEITGKRFVYKFPGDWLTYQKAMLEDNYDLVFDGPHFIGWRMTRLNHTPLVKLPDDLSFVVVVRKENEKIRTIADVTGRTVCGLAPPNLATLTLYHQFTNPSRQPMVVETASFEQGYLSMLEGKCVGALLRDTMHKKLDKGESRAVFQSKPTANQGFSASSRIAPNDQRAITTALLSDGTPQAIGEFLRRFNKGKPLVQASSAEYKDLGVILKGVWGFEP